MKEEKKNSAAKLPTSMMLFLRIFIGGYLCYLAYQLLNTSDISISQTLIYVICTVFFIAGGIIIILSLKMILRGEYLGGFGDTQNDEENIEEITTENVDNSAL